MTVISVLYGLTLFSFERDVGYLHLEKGIGDTVRKTWAVEMFHNCLLVDSLIDVHVIAKVTVPLRFMEYRFNPHTEE